MIAAGIEYELSGEGQPVLCLHGIGGGIESFRPQLEAATGLTSDSSDSGSASTALKGVQVLAWNMPGYGASDTGDWPPTFMSLSASLGDFIETLNLGPICLIGHSIGGMLALEHALRRPEQVTSLVLIGTTPSFGGRDDTFKETFLNARLAPLDAGMNMAEMARQAAPQLVGPTTSKETIESIERPMAEVSERTWRGILECLVTFNRRDDLERVTQPCCLIAGGYDANASARTMERMAERLPNSDFHLIKRTGHMIHQEAPMEVNSIISNFVQRDGP